MWRCRTLPAHLNKKLLTSLYLVGAGGHGKVVAEVALSCGYNNIQFLDDTYGERSMVSGRWPIVGRPQLLVNGEKFCAIGNNALRRNFFDELGLQRSPVLTHPGSIVSDSASVGAGSVVLAGAILNADTQVGIGNIINTAASVDHDCKLDDFVHISPGVRIAGGVSIGKGSWIGIGAVVCEGIKIGENVIVGAGASVICDVPDNTTYVGVPAKRI